MYIGIFMFIFTVTGILHFQILQIWEVTIPDKIQRIFWEKFFESKTIISSKLQALSYH